MIYARMTYDRRWHRLVRGEPLCGAKLVGPYTTRIGIDPKEWCEDCDEEMRERGLENKPAKVEDVTTYTPRFSYGSR